MPENIYRIIFGGDTIDGKNLDEVKKNISSLLKLSSSKVDTLFSQKRYTIKKNLAHATALKYKQAFEKAGALCQIKSDVKKSDKKSYDYRLKKRVNDFVTPKKVQGSIVFQPKTIPRITNMEGGISFGRKDMEKVSFSEIVLFSVFIDKKQNNLLQLLLFIKGKKRPFLVDATRIMYPDFPGVKNNLAPSSLRNFIKFLFEKNPEIIVDCPTYEFMGGSDPQKIEKDPLPMVTGLALELERPKTSVIRKKGRGLTSVKANLKKESTSNHLPSKRIECPKCGFEQDKSKACARCGIIIGKHQECRQPLPAFAPSGDEQIKLSEKNHEIIPKKKESTIFMQFRGNILTFFGLLLLGFNPFLLPVAWAVAVFLSWSTRQTEMSDGYTIRFSGRGEEIWWAPVMLFVSIVICSWAISFSFMETLLKGYLAGVLLIIFLIIPSFLVVIYFFYLIICWVINSISFSWGGKLSLNDSYWGFVFWIFGTIVAMVAVSCFFAILAKAGGPKVIIFLNILVTISIFLIYGTSFTYFMKWLFSTITCSTGGGLVWTGSVMEFLGKILLLLIPLITHALLTGLIKPPIIVGLILSLTALFVFAYLVHYVFRWMVNKIVIKQLPGKLLIA